MAAFGDSFGSYPWGYSSSATQQTFQINYTSAGTTMPWYYPPAPVAPVVEMPEGPLEWLKRRVTEITDLAYAA